jgi:thioredoxin-like negative regulator of GroEL
VVIRSFDQCVCRLGTFLKMSNFSILGPASPIRFIIIANQLAERFVRRPLSCHIALFLTACLSFSPCMAQRGPRDGRPVRTSIRGSVRDAVTHRAMVRVVAIIESADSGYAGQAETDQSGKFDVQGLDQGQYSIRINFPGYYEAVQNVDLSTTPMVYLTFELRPRAGSAPPPVAPEGPEASLDARLAAVPEKARKEFLKARQLWQQGKDLQTCVDHLNRAVKSYARFADAYVLLGSAYIEQNSGAEAKSALDKAIEIDPKLSDAWFTLGTLQNREKDYASAEKSLNEGLKLNDASPEGHYELAKTYWALGRWQDAEPHARKTATLNPNMAPVYVLMGNIALRQQDPDGAIKEFKEYLQLAPNGPMAVGVTQMIQKIEANRKK